MSRFRLHRNDDGQGLIIVLSIVAVCAILLGALEVSVLGDASLAASSTSQEQALQAANSGLADYESWISASTNQWEYAEDFCSSGTFSACSLTNPDSNNPGFAGVPDPSCTTSAYNATSGSPGGKTYYGWVTLHGSTTGGYSEQYQYIVDSSAAKSLGGYAHVWVTGRAGKSHHYTCSTIKALYNGPQLTSVNTVQLAPASCSGTTIPVTAPAAATTIAEVQIVATGGSGQTGGSAGLSAGGGVGGAGETVEATYAASNTSSLSVNIGCQGGSTSSILAGGSGFAAGGSVPTNGNAGGGGGATAVCATTYTGSTANPCTAAQYSTTSALDGDVYMIAGGGGGGGEGLFGATAAGGNGGSGVTTNVTSGVAESGGNGSNAEAWFAFLGGGQGGGGGQDVDGYNLTNYPPTGGAGTHVSKFGDADGGGGGAGYVGASGGGVGFGGGGGGAGASFYNTNTSSPSGGIGSYLSSASGTGFNAITNANQANNYGSVTITWEDSSGNPVSAPVTPASCGPYTERTTQIPALSDVSLEVSGASGGYGNNLSYLDFSSSQQQGGVGATIVATYQNTSQSPVDVTAIQGCEGQIGGDSGTTLGGDGLRTTGAATSGGDNCASCSQGDSGSGGGASAICEGTIAPGSDSAGYNNCTQGDGSLLLIAGGGGGGGGIAGILDLGCSAGNGGEAGVGTSPSPSMGTQLTTGGVAGSAGATSPSSWFIIELCAGSAGGSGGVGSLASYAPTGTAGSDTGSSCSGDGGAGGGGLVGGGGGSASDCPTFGITAGTGGGGGGGSSYLSSSAGSLDLQQCQPGNECLYSPCPTSSGQSNPAANQTNTNATVALDEGEWCPGYLDSNGTVSITDTAIPNSSSVLSQTPAAVPTTPATVIW